jgi:coenzyme F420-0:L-glutamate ligase/coenzyme F420-1:gamma-L-glutamate ligase
MTATDENIAITAIRNLPDVQANDDLVALIADGLLRHAIELKAGDVIVIAQKIVSKSEGRKVLIDSMTPSDRAVELAKLTGKEAKYIELILSESTDVIRTGPNVLIVRHRLGFIMANAGIDRSNLAADDGKDWALLLPVDADASAERIRAGFQKLSGVAPAVIISDSFGRPWRLGTTNVAIGAAGIPTLIDRRGETDRYGRVLEMTEIAFGDSIAAAAGLAMGEAAEGRPVVHIRGLSWSTAPQSALALVRPTKEDLFR